jgi:multidrug efflux system membrane fusion protein
VYVANDDDTVAVHPVTVAQQDDTRAVIAAGIDDGERVVTTGFAQLTDGAKIAIGTQENLERPAGSERRRGPPRGTPSAQSEPTPRTGAVARPAETQRDAAVAQPAATPPDGLAAPVAGQTPGNAQRRTESGGTTTATP